MKTVLLGAEATLLRAEATLLRAEAALALALGWGLVFLLPLRWSRRLFGGVSAPSAAGAAAAPRDLARARAVARRLGRVADRLPWRSTCLGSRHRTGRKPR